MAVQIRHIFRDGTVIEGSLKGRGIEVPYNESTALFYKLVIDMLWDQMQEEANAEAQQKAAYAP